jgi:hypothetical protein
MEAADTETTEAAELDQHGGTEARRHGEKQVVFPVMTGRVPAFVQCLREARTRPAIRVSVPPC